MPAYHSNFNDVVVPDACGCALLPIKTQSRGPAPPAPLDKIDIVDEIIDFFRANVLFTNYEIKGNADRVLVYGTLFINMCLKKLDTCTTKEQAARALHQAAVDSFSIPGESGFPLGGLVKAPKNSDERETIRGYFKQLRESIALRLVDSVYADGSRSKWWMFFAKRKFMNKELLR